MTRNLLERIPWGTADGDAQQRMTLPLAVSLGLHLLVLILMLLSPSAPQPNTIAPTVVDVSLVSLPAAHAQPSGPVAVAPVVPEQPAAAPQAVEPEVVAEPEPPPAPEPPPVLKAVSLAPKAAKPKTSLKKKTFEPSRVIKSEIARIKRKVADDSAQRQRVQKALERLKTEVAPAPAPTPDTPVARTGGSDSRTTGGQQAADLIEIYKYQIAQQVEKNWAFPQQLAGKREDLKTLLVFKVLPDGQIAELFFTERSGNVHLDESARKAVLKSNPVRPHPGGIVVPHILMGLRFTPEGVH